MRAYLSRTSAPTPVLIRAANGFQIILGKVRPNTSPGREPSTSSDHCSLGGYEWGYVAGRWVWSNAAAKSRVRGWKLCDAACLQAVSRASFASTAPTLAKIGQAGWGGWLVRAAAFAAS